MFVKAAAALLACAGLSQATIVINSFNVTGNGTSTITWSSTDLDNDPTSFTIELTNPLFHTQFGVGNNIQTTAGQITFETPALLPGPNYGIQFVAINNATDIIAQTQPFMIVENDVASSTVSSFSGTTTISAIQGTSTAPGRVTSTGASTPSGTTLPNPGSTSNTPTGTSSSSTNAPSVFNGGNGNSGGNAGFALNVPAPASVVIGAVLAGFVAVLA